jgi:Tfp pilus assembly protein PilX
VLNKKAQEEIVGFVLIMVLVVVVLLVFLGISLRNPSESERDSKNIYQLLESSMEQTTNCSIFGRQELLDLGELLSECFSTNSECSNGEKTCKVLNGTVENLLEGSINYGNDNLVKGYSFESIYSSDSSNSNQEVILELRKGVCGGSLSGNSYWAPEFPGSITTTLKLCF